MAAVAFPTTMPLARRRPRSGRSATSQHRFPSHLRVVAEPVFDDPIFDELDRDYAVRGDAHLVWQLSSDTAARREIIPQIRVVSARTFGEAAVDVMPPAARERAVRLAIASPTDALARQSVPISAKPRSSSSSPSKTLNLARSVVRPRYGVRRFFGCVVLGVMLFVGLIASSALANGHQGSAVVIPGSVRTASGYLYTVRPGDTLWSIAARVYPSGDPRSLVASLEGQIHGTVAVPGERLVLP